MEREILFKAQRVEDREWVQGSLILPFYKQYNPEIQTWHVDGFLRAISLTHEVFSNTLCQFTGLLDSTGKKIFEGDRTEDNRIVKYNDGCFFLGDTPLALSASHRKVIGNIHD